MWLKVSFEEGQIFTWSKTPGKVTVSIIEHIVAPTNSDNTSFRLSPVFGLVGNHFAGSLDDTEIHFFNFPNAYRILGRIDKKGSDQLKTRTFFSIGLCSIIVITKDSNDLKEFRRITAIEDNAHETWRIKNSVIVEVDYKLKDETSSVIEFVANNYERLPVSERAIVDEFCVTIKLLLPKLMAHMPEEAEKIRRLINEVNSLIDELVFLVNPSGTVPKTLNEYTIDELKSEKLNQVIRHQNLDRIIQINSSLSYISTQAFSGAIPILERRSLIRRNSLLGVGTGILALNNIARFIETSFSRIPFSKVIGEYMKIAAPLKGVDNLPQYDSSEWHLGAIDQFVSREQLEVSSYFKLPYFSGRLGFRETEYSIAAALQAITSGASLEWSLMTLTHEMLHGHVRNIISLIFYGEEASSPNMLRSSYYDCFQKRINKAETNEKLIDSIRNIFLTYCSYTVTHGSLSVMKPYKSNKFNIHLLPERELWDVFENESRNISEIFVHVLDLHYFYASRVSEYIPLIWCSWIAVPHIHGDVRQYILRSLLAIASKQDGNSFVRFTNSAARLAEIFERHKRGKLNYPVIQEILRVLSDKEKLRKEYFSAFKASLIIVDLVTNLFISNRIRSHLFNDELVKWSNDESDEQNFEQKFEYELPSGFNDETISSPLSYLLDRMIKELNSNREIVNLERETTLQFLALAQINKII